ncbi:MAG: Ig-like domain-containing protein [Verrucomicrobia bacterium]|nr:Ig-like domain-containing protein [Verrucomicrobiota bacterium]
MKTSDIVKSTRPHLKHRALPLAALALMAFASSAAAAPLYQESFATPCASADFSATYPGFTKSGPAVNVDVAGYASTDSAAGSGGLWRTMPESMPIYDWALPLTVSAEIGANGTNGGQSIGVFFGNASGLATAGITFRPFIPSVPNGANVESANGNNRGQFGIGSNSAIDPGVVGGGVLTKISLTIRENAGNSALFDWLAKVNDVEVWTGGTSGWHLGINKNKLNAGGGLSTFGLGYDGMTPRIDNLTLELAGTVTTMDTTTTVVSSNNPSTFGDAVTFIATIAPVSGVLVPVGSVQFKVDGTNLNSPVPVTLGGIATTGTTAIPIVGSPHEVTAVFTPATGSFNTSTGTLSGGQTVLTRSGPPAPPLYQESFSTSCTSTAFSGNYSGFSQSGPAVNVNADGYASTDSQGSGGLWRTMPVYDWSGPLTISAQIGAADGSGGNSIGVFFGNASGLAAAGITFRPFIPSDTNGAYVGTSNGNNRGSFGLGGNTAIAPGVVDGGALTKISFTIRQNAGNPLLFDWLAKVNDTEVWTAVAYGGTGTSGWHLGIPKNALGGSLSTFGLGYDGMTPRIDNLTLEGPVSAPPAGSYDAWAGSPDGYGLTGDNALRGADPDGDGFTNLQEFLFGTAPVAGNGTLVASETVGGDLVLHWLQRSSGCSYLLQESITMGAGDWITSVIVSVPDVDQSGVPTGYERYKATIPIGVARKFFRVEGTEN